MILRDAKAIKLGTTTINKIYSGTYKVYDKNKTALEGYCNQLQTTGKNLFDKTTTNKLNAYINTSKKIISDNTARLAYMTCLPSTTYTVSKTAGTRFRVIATSTVPAINTVGDVYGTNDSGTSITITTAADSTYLAIYYWTSDHDTITEQEALDTLQVEIGSSASPYEPYSGGVAVPSPDHPQPIETMMGRQIAYGRNLFDKNNATVINSYIDGNGNLVKDSNPNNKTIVFRVKTNTTYTVSKIKSNRFRMGTNPELIESGTLYNKVSDDNATSLDISTGTDTYLYVFYDNTSASAEEIKNSVQIKEKFTIDLKSKNLFNVDNLAMKTSATSITTKTDNNNFSISSNGNYQFLIVLIGKVSDLIEKTLTCNMSYQSNNNISNGEAAFVACDKNGENRTTIKKLTIGENTINGSTTIASNLDNNKYVGIRLYATGATSPNTVTYTNVQVEIRRYSHHIRTILRLRISWDKEQEFV